ncbi:FGGY-family carbohydrate kinase [Pedobacter sp. SAFR-022]|uniref:FGGY-family carbohydrate kinase n=1 Tax=Pedobacter sp. SAFR-022 TaxID=3436861 RepID=UPI003F7D155E
MAGLRVIAIFDVGKTNKKLFLFDEHYRIVYEKTARFLETRDEDGELCENLDSIRISIFESLNEVLRNEEYELIAINFSTYGASLVYLDEHGQPLTPLYNYLKNYPAELEQQFYAKYGGKTQMALETSSPASGSLNAGLQIYRIKYQLPELFQKIRYALHLPQYVSYLISGKIYSDMTSIGCHTHLWDFKKQQYHDWVIREELDKLLPPIMRSDEVIETTFMGKRYIIGAGLHDSSAALIPYQASFSEPFILLSTGTWCISMNPFNASPLTAEELENDCLAYIGYHGKPVKASRLFAGNEHEQHVKRIAATFDVDVLVFRNMAYEPEIIARLTSQNRSSTSAVGKSSAFESRDLKTFRNATEAYHQLMLDLVDLQFRSTSLIINGTPIKKIFVDGGFSKNAIYMNLLALAFPDIEVYAAAMAQATALGTAIAIHKHWNKKPLANDIIALKFYSVKNQVL